MIRTSRSLVLGAVFGVVLSLAFVACATDDGGERGTDDPALRAACKEQHDHCKATCRRDVPDNAERNVCYSHCMKKLRDCRD